MTENMGLSRIAFENIIFQKTSERLKKIKWGENCHSLINALTYPEDWLFESVRGNENRKRMKSYLFSEGFTLKVARCFGREIATWMFPSKPKRPLFEKIKKDYVDAYETAIHLEKLKAINDVTSFGECDECNKAYSLENSFYRKFFQDKLGDYNQELIRTKNMLGDDTRKYIDSRVTRQGDAIFLTKNNNFYGWIEQAEAVHDMGFNSSLKLIKLIIRSMIDSRAFSKVPNKYVFGALPSQAEAFKKAFEPYGISITLMPNYPEKEYYRIRETAEYEIDLYLEVVNGNGESEDAHVQALMKLCDSIT